MRKLIRLGVAAAFVLVLAVPTGALSASGGSAAKGDRDARPRKHDFETKLSIREHRMREKALNMKLAGKVAAGAKVVQVAKGQYVQLAREKTERIFVVIAEFGDTRHPAYPDNPVSEAVQFDGPLHNAIPAPDRTSDNTTLWQPDFNRAHYEDMYFNRMRSYFERQSSGRYSVEGDVVEWVKVPFNQARYGTDDCNADGTIDYAGGVDSIVCANVWFLIRDAMAFWVKEQLDSGKTMAQIQDYLETFDIWDRYDVDFDGDFDEADGVIDHFQIVHAGGDQAAGRDCVSLDSGCDPQYGTDAIWSHRWAAQLHPGGPYSVFDPSIAMVEIGRGGTSGGLPIPNNPTGVWAFDYTIQPENGGLGVFAHEYGHDFGLPDLYDTTGNTCPIPDGFCENSTGFWSLMSSGGNIGDGDGPPTGQNGIGDAPTNLGAYEKLLLGWLNYEVAFAGRKSEHKLGPAGANTKQAQAVVVVLPPRARDVEIYEPLAGSSFAQWSTSGNNLDTNLAKGFALAGGGTLTADVNYETEFGWDFWFVEVSSNNGATWTPVAITGLSQTGDAGSGFNASNTGVSGTSGGWISASAALPAGTTNVRFRYRTDAFVAERGLVVDNVTVAGGAADTFESGGDGWTASGFVRTGPINSVSKNQYYFVENRNYQADDTSLRTAYNFGFRNVPPGPGAGPDWVEYFPYQDGMLVTYWDTFWSDNNVTSHPGEGEILPVDAHPTPMIRGDGQPWRSRVQAYDSTFGLDPTDAITLHLNSVATTHASQPAVSVFDDRNSYWSPLTPYASVKVPTTGTSVRVKSVSAQGALMQIEVAPAK